MKLDLILSKSFRTTNAARAFAHFLPLGADLVLADDYQLRKDPAIARHNVSRAMSVMLDRLPDLSRLLPSADVVALAELPTLALAVVHAAGRVPSAAPSAGEIAATLAANRPLRAATLKYLEVVADLGLVPVGRVSVIRAGSGKLDEARDALAIVALFHEYEAVLANKHPFTKEQFETLATNGAWLVEAITPTHGVPVAVSTRTPEGRDRDRLVALLEARYDQLRTAGVVCFGIRDVDAKVPPLWSATRESAPSAEAPAATPAPGV